MTNDEAYNNRDYIPRADAFIARWEDEAQVFRAREAALGFARLNEPYGDHPRERFDLFHPRGRAAGLVVFLHGGYWRLFDRGYWSHFAEGPLARDWAVAVPSYPLCPEVRIADITRSAARAINRASELVPMPLSLAGHSAGGHLVARMACGDTELLPEVAARMHHIASISPVADLRPLVETTMNEDLRMDEAAAAVESPALLEKLRDVPVSVWVGGDERPAFLDQACWLAEAWPGTVRHVVPGRHHFDVIDALRDPANDLVRSLTG